MEISVGDSRGGPRMAGSVDKQSRWIDGSQVTLPQPKTWLSYSDQTENLKMNFQLVRKSPCTIKGYLSSQVGLHLRGARRYNQHYFQGHTTMSPNWYFLAKCQELACFPSSLHLMGAR